MTREEREEAIRCLSVHSSTNGSGLCTDEQHYEAKQMAIKALEQTTWIPVSKRLPEESGRYLAYIVDKHDSKLQYIMTCDYSADSYWNWFPDDESASDNVIAWMPLPEPYKTESEDKECGK